MNYAKIVCLLLIFNHCIVQPIELPWYLDAIQATSLSYTNKCILIDVIQAIKQAIKKASLLTGNLITTQTYQEIKEEIAQKQLTIKNNYHEKEQQMIHKLGTTVGFSTTEWAQCLQTINTIKQQASQQSGQQNIFHDCGIPEKNIQLIKTLLSHNHINPNHVNLIYHATENKELFACAISFLHYTYCPEKSNFIQNPSIKQTIIFYKNLWQETESNQLAIYAHEIEHIVQQHGITLNVIEQYAQHYLNKDRTVLNNNSEFQQLRIIHEEQAEIFAALKDPDSAQALVGLRAQKYYPGHLYEAHYHDLVEINNLWKVEKIIKAIHFAHHPISNL